MIIGFGINPVVLKLGVLHDKITIWNNVAHYSIFNILFSKLNCAQIFPPPRATQPAGERVSGFQKLKFHHIECHHNHIYHHHYCHYHQIIIIINNVL